jgi:hypothetical protein
LLAVNALMSDPAMPAVPKLAWRKMLPGEAAISPRVMKGAERPVRVSCFRKERREREGIGISIQ